MKKELYGNMIDITIGNRTAKKVEEAIKNVTREAYMLVELTNYSTEDRSTTYYSPFTPSIERGKEIKDRLEKFFFGYQEITPKNYEMLISGLEIIQKELEKTRPVRDKRLSQEQMETDKKAREEREEKRKAEEEEFNKKAITIPTGKMGIYLNITFDDSDSMSDYFHPHSPLEERLLTIVKKQNETEKLARAAIAQISSLKDIEFSWHTENWSMGHGNYLMSTSIQETREHKAYDGRKEVSCRYEICFQKTYKQDMQMLPHVEYLGELEQVKTVISKQDTPPKIEYAGIPWLKDLIPQNGNNHQDIVITKEGDWTWATGEGTRALKDHLKLLGGRWSKKRGAWYFTKPITEAEILKGEI